MTNQAHNMSQDNRSMRSVRNVETVAFNIDKLLNFKPSGKYMDCTVFMLDGFSEVFRLDVNSYGQHLFEKVLENLQLNERAYFGITYKDDNDDKHWLDYTSLIRKQIKDNQMIFDFQVKFYPPEIGMIRENLTRYYLTLQIRQDICDGRLQCSYNDYVTLAAFAIQAQVGDYNEYEMQDDIDYIRPHPVAPIRVQSPEFMEDVMHLHKTHMGMIQEEADFKLLENAKKMPLYGMDFHYMKEINAENVTLSVNYLGINIFRQQDGQTNFPWYRFVQVRYTNKKLKLKFHGIPEIGPYFENREIEFGPIMKLKFKCLTTVLSARAFKSIIDHHNFFRSEKFRIRLREYREKHAQELAYQRKKKIMDNTKSANNVYEASSTIDAESIEAPSTSTVPIQTLVLKKNHKINPLPESKEISVDYSKHSGVKILQSLKQHKNQLGE